MRKPFTQQFIAVFLLTAIVGSLSVKAQVGGFRVFVNGTELPPNYHAEKLGARIMIPVFPVAQQLGYLIQIDGKSEKVSVQRGGIVAEFLKQTFEIRENGVSVAVVPNTADILFPADTEQTKLPLEVISALLKVSVSTDTEQNIVRIEPQETVNSKIISREKKWGINLFDYNYDSSFSGDYFAQNLNLRSEGNIGSNMFEATATFTGLSMSSLTRARNLNFTLERQRGDRFQLGDIRNFTGSTLSLMNTQVRGLAYENAAFDNKAVYAIYGGRSVGAAELNINNLFEVRRRRFNYLNFNTNFFAGRFSYNPNPQISNGSHSRNLSQNFQSEGWSFSAGTAIFKGKGFGGQIVDSTIRYRLKNLIVEGEAAAGNFSSVESNFSSAAEKRNFKGFGTGLILRTSYTPWNFISFQGYYNKFSPNFSSPLRNSGYNDRGSRSFGFVARPFNRLSVSASLSSNQARRFRGSGEMLATDSYTFSLAYDPSTKLLPRMSFNVTDTKNPVYGSLSVRTANFSRDFKNIRAFANYVGTRFNTSTAHSIGFGAGIDSGKIGNFQAQTFFSLNKTAGIRAADLCNINSGQTNSDECSFEKISKLRIGGSSASLDWTPRDLLFKKFQISLGGGYTKNSLETNPLIRAIVSFPFLNNQQIRIGYSNSGYGQEFHISLTGSLAFWRQKKARNNVSAVSENEMAKNGVVEGRVYLDENFDHKFDAQNDTPLRNIRLLLDNGRTVKSDDNGFYKFDDVADGKHNLEILFEDIRANLVPAGGLQQKVTVNPLSIVETSFRLVKSGMLAGRVWYDQNGDGKFEESEALANVRVVSGSGRDTYSDTDGTYLLSDLPPGQQSIFIDPRYLPVEVEGANSSLVEEIKSGQILKNIDFVLKTRVREEREVNFPSNP